MTDNLCRAVTFPFEFQVSTLSAASHLPAVEEPQPRDDDQFYGIQCGWQNLIGNDFVWLLG
jgi:hypothetical protein